MYATCFDQRQVVSTLELSTSKASLVWTWRRVLLVCCANECGRKVFLVRFEANIVWMLLLSGL